MTFQGLIHNLTAQSGLAITSTHAILPTRYRRNPRGQPASVANWSTPESEKVLAKGARGFSLTGGAVFAMLRPMLNQTIQGPTAPRSATSLGQPEVREMRVAVAMQYLGKASEGLLAAYDQLSKRLHIVSRIDPPAAGNQGNCPAEPSTNCQMADDINNVTALLASLTNQISYQTSILEV